MRGCPPKGEEYSNYGSYVQNLAIKKINDIVFCIQKIPNHKKKIIHIDQWRPTTIGNFVCSTHGYSELWFFPWDTGQMPERGHRWGTTACQLPTCVQELPTRLYPSMMIWWYPKVTFLHFKWRVFGPDEWRINPLKSRRFQKDFKMISRWFQDDFKMISKWFQDDFKMISRWFQDDSKMI